jgi:hypothetical protein
MKCESRQWLGSTKFALQNILGIPEADHEPTFCAGYLIAYLAYLDL